MTDMSESFNPDTASFPEKVDYVTNYFKSLLPDWTLDDGEINYRLMISWPLTNMFDNDERLQTMSHFIQELIKRYFLVGYGEEAAFGHRWHMGAAFNFSLELHSDMNEALAEVMGDLSMSLLMPLNFRVVFEKVAN